MRSIFVVHSIFDLRVIFSVRGANGAIVKKIYAHDDDMIKGIQLGDLKQDNLRQVNTFLFLFVFQK